MALELKIGKCSRQVSEPFSDAISVLITQDFTACIAADGDRGWWDHGFGDFISQRAISVVQRELQRTIQRGLNRKCVSNALRQTVRQAHTELRTFGAIDRELQNVMAATIVVAVWYEATVFLASVGDCRCYRLRGNQLEQLTVDDTLAAACVAAGGISPEEAEAKNYDRILWKFLGCADLGECPAVTAWALEPRDRYLLCTDGLRHFQADSQLQQHLQSEIDVQRCAERLCQQALDNGSRDNVSCIVVEVVEA